MLLILLSLLITVPLAFSSPLHTLQDPPTYAVRCALGTNLTISDKIWQPPLTSLDFPAGDQSFDTSQFVPCESVCDLSCTADAVLFVSMGCFKILYDADEIPYYILLPLSDPSCDELSDPYKARFTLATSESIDRYNTRIDEDPQVVGLLVTTTTCPCDVVCSTTPELSELLQSGDFNYTQDTPFFDCSITVPEFSSQKLSKDAGFLPFLTDGSDLWNDLDCVEVYSRGVALLTHNSTASSISPQLRLTKTDTTRQIVIQSALCETIFDSATFDIKTPFNINVNNPTNLFPTAPTFLCAKQSLDLLSIPQVLATVVTCEPKYLCYDPTQNLMNLLKCDDPLSFPKCSTSQSQCALPVNRMIECRYGDSDRFNVPTIKNMLNNNTDLTEFDTFEDLVSLVPFITTDALKKLWDGIYKMLQEQCPIEWDNMMQTPQILPNSLPDFPTITRPCECDVMLYCAATNTLRDTPQANLPNLLAPCLNDDGTDTTVGFPTTCDACSDVILSQTRDFFCRHGDGTFKFISLPTNATSKDLRTACPTVAQTIPAITQACTGSTSCLYAWKCPILESTTTQDNLVNILSEPSCALATTFSNLCYSTIASEGLPNTSPILVDNIVNYPSACTSSGNRLRKSICFPYTVDVNKKIQLLPSSTQYDRTCALASYDVITTPPPTSVSPPQTTTPCRDYTQCVCSVPYTGPSCNIPPKAEFSLSTIDPQPAVITSTYNNLFNNIKIGTSFTIKWTYFGNPDNMVYLYLTDANFTGPFTLLATIKATALSVNITMPQYAPLSPLKVISLDFATDTPLIIAQTSRVVAWVGQDLSATRKSGVVIKPFVNVIPLETQCGVYRCHQENLYIYSNYTDPLYTHYSFSGSEDACVIAPGSTAIIPTNKYTTSGNPLLSLNSQSLLCRCVPSSTLTFDSTCTFSPQCQTDSSSLFLADTITFAATEASTVIFDHDPEAYATDLSSVSQVDVPPQGLCGPNGYVPTQHRFSESIGLNIPARCSIEDCECFNPLFSPTTRCVTCTRSCNPSSDGGVLNSTTCECACNIGFSGPTCSSCAAYSLFTVTSLNSQFMRSIVSPITPNERQQSDIFFHSFETHLATLLAIPIVAVGVSRENYFIQGNSAKFIVKFSGSCSRFDEPSTPVLYSDNPNVVSVFTLFERWSKLMAYVTANKAVNEMEIFSTKTHDHSPSLSAYLSNLFIQSHADSDFATFSTSISTSIPTTTDIQSFLASPLLTLMGNVGFADLYAPQCLGTQCPKGENPYDTLQCLSPTSPACTPKPTTKDPKKDGINQSVLLYIIIGIVLLILFIIIVGIITFCCCTPSSPKDSLGNDDPDASQSRSQSQVTDASETEDDDHGVEMASY